MDVPKDKLYEDLSALLDKELSGDEKTDVEELLTENKETAQEFENFKSLGSLIKSSVDEVEVPDLWEGIKDRLPSVEELIEEDLSAYMDGELPPAAQDGIKNYLEENEEAKEKYNLLLKTNQLLSSSMELPEDVDYDIWDKVNERLTADCEIIRGELSPYLDQEVVTHRHRAITTHLVDCLDCRGHFEMMSSVSVLLEEHYRPEIPEDLDLWPEVKRKLQVVPFKQKKPVKAAKNPIAFTSHPRFKVVAVAAAAVIGLLGTVAVWLASPDEQQFSPVSPEAYLIESSFEQTSDAAEAVIYEQ